MIENDFMFLCGNSLLTADKVRSRRKDVGLCEKRVLIAQKLRDFGYKRQEIAYIMQRSRSMVSRMLAKV